MKKTLSCPEGVLDSTSETTSYKAECTKTNRITDKTVEHRGGNDLHSNVCGAQGRKWIRQAFVEDDEK